MFPLVLNDLVICWLLYAILDTFSYKLIETYARKDFESKMINIQQWRWSIGTFLPWPCVKLKNLKGYTISARLFRLGVRLFLLHGVIRCTHEYS